MARSGKRWFRIENKAATPGKPVEADVYLYDEIGYFGVSAKDFVGQVAALDVEQINLFINSPGGDVFDGLAILNVLRRHGATVDVRVDGLAASAASFIAMAGDRITMGRNAQMMIHDAQGFALGDASSMAKLAALLDQQSDNIAQIYAMRAGGDVADWRAAMRAETWYSAEEAVMAGLADDVAGDGEDPEVANRFDFERFAHAGRSHAPTPRAFAVFPSAPNPPAEPVDNPTQSEGADTMSETLKLAIRDRLGITVPVDALTDDTILAALDEALSEPDEAPEVANALPEGTVAVEADALAALKADAAAGREAKDQLDAQRRAQIVDSAITEGRIVPASRDKWLAQLAADEAGVTNVIRSLDPVLNLTPKGNAGTVKDAADDDSYPAHWKR